nr:sigma-E factor negative regulatory protein [Vibrio maerlii]
MVKIMADKEKLSALMDGELIDKALISELENSQDDQQTWKNYHLIGDVMRGEAPAKPEWNIAESVAAAIELEPTYGSETTQQAEVVPAVEAQPTPNEAKKGLPAWFTQFGQVAMAACVSMAVIIGVQQYGGEDSVSPNNDIPVLQTVPFAGSVEPVSLTRESVNPAQPQHNEANLQEQRRRINAMLQDYELQLRLNEEVNDIDVVKSEIE